MAQEEANDVKDEVAPDTTVAESSTAEEETQDDVLAGLNSDDDSEANDEPEGESEGDEEQGDSDESEEEADDADEADEADEPDDAEPTKADQRKEQLNGEIRDLVSEKNRLKDEVEKLNNQVYQPQTKEELVEEGYSEEEARVMALEQKLELKDYNERVVNAQIGLAQEAQRIEREFPIFNPDSPDYDQEVAANAAEILSASLEIDPNTGQIMGSRVEPYKLYKAIAGAYQKSNVSGQVAGQKEAVRQLAKVEAPSSAKRPDTTKKDPLLDILASDDD